MTEKRRSADHPLDQGLVFEAHQLVKSGEAIAKIAEELGIPSDRLPQLEAEIEALDAPMRDAWDLPLAEGLCLHVEEVQGKGWRMFPTRDLAEGLPYQVPRSTSRGQPGLQSNLHLQSVLGNTLDLLKDPDNSARSNVQTSLQKVFGFLQRIQWDEEDRTGHEIRAQPPTELSEEEEVVAGDLLREEDFLEEVIVDRLRQIGLVGEEDSGKALYLTTLTRFSGRTVSVNLKADSSTGKNYTLDKVLDLVPPEDVVHFDRITPQSLFYADALDLAHKVLVIGEMAGADEAMFSLRTLQERGHLSLLATVSEKGEAPQSRTIQVKGPCVVFSTTTLAELGEDEETRTFSMALDDRPEQTQEINLAHAQLYDSKTLLSEEEKEPVRNVQRLVKITLEREGLLGKMPWDQVSAPWAEGLADVFPGKDVRFRRDFPRVAALVAGHALLHAPVRTQRDERGRIVAELLEDYEPVREIFNLPFMQSAKRLHPHSEEILRAGEELAARTTDGFFKRGELAQHLGRSEAWVRNYVKPLEGRYFHVEEGGQGRAFLYSVREWLGDARLPSIREVREAFLKRVDRVEGADEL